MSFPYRYAPGIEVLGQSASAIFNNINRDQVIDSLKEHGLDQLEPDQWYSVDGFLNVMGEWLSEGGNASANLVSIGMAIVENAPLPPEVADWPLEQKLILPKIIHEQSHRNGLPGGYIIEWVSETHVKYIEDVVYPDDMIYGYIFGIARRFLLPEGFVFTVEYDENEPTQANGGDKTIIHLKWEME